jgi:hypothetical protein
MLSAIPAQASINTTATVQFSAAGYSVGEAAGGVTVTVTRAGDTSLPAAVAYQTADTDTFTVGCADTANNHGSAYARCDFATAVGTLSFAPGETSKTFTVPVIDDAFVEGDETFQVKLADASGAGLGGPVAATVTIKDNDQPGQPNPVFTSPFFVRQHYLDFLAREPDQGGFNAYLNLLNGCPDVNNVDPSTPSAGCDRGRRSCGHWCRVTRCWRPRPSRPSSPRSTTATCGGRRTRRASTPGSTT